jgi:hypothetical protein
VGTGNSGILPSDGAYSAIASAEGVEQSLLLAEHEQGWAAEMAAEGAGHLPIKWYRQTPRQAIMSSYGIANMIVGGLVNFGPFRPAHARTHAREGGNRHSGTLEREQGRECAAENRSDGAARAPHRA